MSAKYRIIKHKINNDEYYGIHKTIVDLNDDIIKINKNPIISYFKKLPILKFEILELYEAINLPILTINNHEKQ